MYCFIAFSILKEPKVTNYRTIFVFFSFLEKRFHSAKLFEGKGINQKIINILRMELILFLGTTEKMVSKKIIRWKFT